MAYYQQHIHCGLPLHKPFHHLCHKMYTRGTLLTVTMPNRNYFSCFNILIYIVVPLSFFRGKIPEWHPHQEQELFTSNICILCYKAVSINILRNNGCTWKKGELNIRKTFFNIVLFVFNVYCGNITTSKKKWMKQS